MFVKVFFILALASFARCQDESQEDFPNDDFEPSDPLVKKFWGMQDVITSVGKLFYYKIPSDAFDGVVSNYRVEGSDGKPLPSWLTFNSKLYVLEGVPTESDVGDTLINVKATDSQKKYVSDVFTLEVLPLFQKNYDKKRKCKKSDTIVMMSLVIDRNILHISPKGRVAIMKKLSRYLGISASTLLMLRQHESNEENSLLGSGDGNVKYPASDTSSIIMWQIGCNETIWSDKIHALEKVKSTARDGSLSEMLQLPVIRWNILSSKNAFRSRRHASDTSTRKTVNNTKDDEEEYDDSEDVEDDLDEEGEKTNLVIPSKEDRIKIAKENSVSTDQKSMVKMVTLEDDKDSDIDPISENAKKAEDTDTEEEGMTESDPVEGDFSFVSQEPVNEMDVTEKPPSSDAPTTPLLRVIESNTTTLTSPASSTTTSTTEASTKVPSGPTLKKKIPKLQVVSGKLYKYEIPEDTFVDDVDGNTRNLTLSLDNKNEHWIQLNAQTQEIFVLAPTSAISKYEDHKLVAKNAAGLSADTEVIVNVQNPKHLRKINFEMGLSLKSTAREEGKFDVIWQHGLVQRLAALYGDKSSDFITVTAVSYDPFKIMWTNDTLVADQCDHAMKMIRMISENGKPNDNLKRVVGADVNVLDVQWKGMESCKSSSEVKKFSPKLNFTPTLVNKIDNLTAVVGELLVFKVPDDVFFDPDPDCNDQNICQKCKLQLKLSDDAAIPPEHWLQFNDKDEEFYGLPGTKDVGTKSYQLSCTDRKEGLTAVHMVDVKVKPAKQTFYTAEFSIRMDTSYESFVKNPSTQRLFIERLAKLFGDKNASNVVMSGFAPGSLVATWHNKSLPVQDCPEAEIRQLRMVMLTDQERLKSKVLEVMGEEFGVLSASVTPIGICEGELTEHFFPSEKPPTLVSFIHSSDYFETVILPGALIIGMILVAGAIACILYHRRSKGKMSFSRDGLEKRSLRSRGIPVIFQDELEEKLEATNKSPIMLKEEKPPLPPPEYQRTLPMATTALLSDFEEANNYSRSHGSGRSGRSKQTTPIYRKPPPYIPP